MMKLIFMLLVACMAVCIHAQNVIEVIGDTILLKSPNGTKQIMMRTEGASGELKSLGDLYLRGQGNNVLINHVISDGKVGVGTNSPVEKLDVHGAVKFGNTTTTNEGTIRFTGTDFEGRMGGAWASLTSGVGGSLWTQSGNDIYFDSGRVGIGTSNPTSALHILVDSTSGETADITTTGHLQTNSDLLNLAVGALSSNNSQIIECRKGFDSVFAVNSNGSVKVGTVSVPSGFLMAVDGKGIFEEVHVEMSGNWPDYVFDDGYSLLPLDQLENFIDEHKHLPNIPAASEIDENSVAIGEMQRLMMEKIEELTLYIIQLENRIDELLNEEK